MPPTALLQKRTQSFKCVLVFSSTTKLAFVVHPLRKDFILQDKQLACLLAPVLLTAESSQAVLNSATPGMALLKMCQQFDKEGKVRWSSERPFTPSHSIIAINVPPQSFLHLLKSVSTSDVSNDTDLFTISQISFIDAADGARAILRRTYVLSRVVNEQPSLSRYVYRDG